jgi:hypothetical protein
MVTVFDGFTPAQIGTTGGVFNLSRFMPAFVIGASLSIFLSRNTDAQADRLRLSIANNRPVVSQTLRRLERELQPRRTTFHEDGKLALAALGPWIQLNARAFAYQEILKYLALFTASGLAFVLVVPLTRVTESQ